MKRIIKDPTFNIYRNGGNVERRGNEITKDGIMKLADIEKIEADVLEDLTRELRNMYEEEKKSGQSFSDWIKTKSIEDLKRIELSDGGKVVDFLKYAKPKEPKIKKINISQGDMEKTVVGLSKDEKDLIKDLLRRSGVLVGD
jgi:hypothetical protein